MGQSSKSEYDLVIQDALDKYANGKFEEALILLNTLPVVIQQRVSTQHLKIELEFAWISHPVKQADELKAFIDDHPDQLPAVAMLAAWHVSQKQYPKALQLFYQIMQQDRGFENDFGRKSIVKTLTLLESDDQLIEHYKNLIKSISN